MTPAALLRTIARRNVYALCIYIVVYKVSLRLSTPHLVTAHSKLLESHEGVACSTAGVDQRRPDQTKAVHSPAEQVLAPLAAPLA
jgi:hypothetical protein